MICTKKAQVSIELLIALIFVFALFATLQIIFFEWDLKTLKTQEGILMQDICTMISSSIYDANTIGFVSSNFYIPPTIIGKNLTIAVYEKYILLNLEGREHSCFYIAKYLTKNNASPPFNLSNGTYYLENIDGMVNIRG